MTKIFIDDSVHERGNFILSGIVITEKDVDKEITKSLLKNGFNPGNEEFKSGLHYKSNTRMLHVRDDVKRIINSYCKIGLVILPISQRKNIGIETLKGLKKILEFNDFGETLDIYLDENYFQSKIIGEKYASEYGFTDCKLFLEVDSKKAKGIQLADFVAHTFSIMLLEQMGLIDKKVKVSSHSGYDPDSEIELGFELWASLRYNFIGKIDINKFEKGESFPILLTEPYGLYISEYCCDDLRKVVKERFGKIYLGCIH